MKNHVYVYALRRSRNVGCICLSDLEDIGLSVGKSRSAGAATQFHSFAD